MGTTNRAEENKLLHEDLTLNVITQEFTTCSIKAVRLADRIIEWHNARNRQSEIDELTKEVERLRKENESFTEVWEEMAGLFSKRYDDEECGIHFKQRMKFLINKLQS